jgi:GntR family transcriptional regulator, transcriptional repressor for pyruvate dehydrogenase complex
MTTPGEGTNGAVGSPPFQAVRTGNAFEETVERILRSVKLGAIRPGERLPPERELAAQLRVSRDTLREAIHALAAEGIVASTRGRSGGTRVLRRPEPLSAERLHDVVKAMPGGGLEDALTFRRVVEAGAAEAAACRRLDPAERRLLGGRMEAAEQADATDYRIADTRYHLALADLSGSTALAAAVAEARLRVNDLLDAIPMLEANLRHSSEQHRVISAAVLGGDPDSARRAMTEHLEGTAVLLRGFLEG